MASLVFGGISLLVSFLGYKVATAVALATAGRAVARMAIYRLGGQYLSIIPDSWISAAISRAIPSPLVILGTDIQTRCQVKAAYIMLSYLHCQCKSKAHVTILKLGRKRVLIQLKDVPLIGSVFMAAKNWLQGPEYKVLKSQANINLIENYNQQMQPKKVDKTLQHPKASPTPQMKVPIDQLENSAVLLEFSEEEIQTIVDNFDGEKMEMSRDQFREFINKELPKTERNLYSCLMEIVDDKQSVNDDEWTASMHLLPTEPLATITDSEFEVKKYKTLMNVRIEENYQPNCPDREWVEIPL